MRRIRRYASPVPRNPSKREAMPRFFRQGNALRSLDPSFASRKTVFATSNIVRNVKHVAIMQLYDLELINLFKRN